MGKVINVDKLAKKLEKELENKAKNRPSASLISIQAGGAAASEIYIKNQKKIATKIGVDFYLCRLPEKASQSEVVAKVKEFNADCQAGGIIINRPFPNSWNAKEVFSAISPKKDVEGVSPYSLGKLFYGDFNFTSPTVLAVLAILESLKIDLYGKNITVVGFSSLIGKPLVLILGDKLATISATHIATYEKEKLPFYLKNADIVVSAVGKPHFIKTEWIKENSVIIDVGISKRGTKIAGDLEFKTAVKKAAYITPVPGGVGRLTSLFLLKNLLEAK